MARKTSVLIVEDNVPLATCLEMLLEANSYEVARTVDGPGGLQSIRLADYDVILCDLVMPGMTGDQLYEAVREVKPKLCDRFIFMSGDTEKGKWSEVAAQTGRPMFWKPFPLEDLLAGIQRVIQENAPKRIMALAS
jgi:CheY-like chemotaxis protein